MAGSPTAIPARSASCCSRWTPENAKLPPLRPPAAQYFASAGPVALAELVRLRQAHPRELVELFLRRIEQINPYLNAFRTTLPEHALAEADAMTEPSGLLAGVPIAVKDDMRVAGQVTTVGSRSYGASNAADSEAVRRL